MLEVSVCSWVPSQLRAKRWSRCWAAAWCGGTPMASRQWGRWGCCRAKGWTDSSWCAWGTHGEPQTGRGPGVKGEERWWGNDLNTKVDNLHSQPNTFAQWLTVDLLLSLLNEVTLGIKIVQESFQKSDTMELWNWCLLLFPWATEYIVNLLSSWCQHVW